MRVLPVVSQDWNDLALLVFRLFLNPEDLKATQSLDHETKARAMAAVLDVFGAENIPLSTDEILQLRDSHPGVPPVITSNLTNLRDAFIAGQILVKALRLAKRMPEKASVANAIKIVSYGFKKGPHPLGRSAMLNIWGRFKSVSHLSGAFYADGKALLPMARLLDIINDLPPQDTVRPNRKFTERERVALDRFNDVFLFKPFNDALVESYPRLFAAAEALRADGEMHFARGQKVRGLPLLDPSVMWSVPKSFSLPKTSVDYGPAITDLEKRILLKIK